MDHISNLIPRVLSKKGLKDQATASYAVHLARQWIEQQLPQVWQNLHPKKVADGVLTIDSDHSIASQELSQKSADLMKYLNAAEGISIREVRISLARG